MPADTWVTLRTFDTQPMAELARVALLNTGIPCRILNAEVVSMDWLLGNAVGYIPLQVPEDQLEAAGCALGGDSSETEFPPDDCPKCGEPLISDGLCPICGRDVEADATDPRASELNEVRRENPEDDNLPGSLDGLREFGKSAISAYLFFVFFAFIMMVIALLSLLADPFF